MTHHSAVDYTEYNLVDEKAEHMSESYCDHCLKNRTTVHMDLYQNIIKPDLRTI